MLLPLMLLHIEVLVEWTELVTTLLHSTMIEYAAFQICKLWDVQEVSCRQAGAVSGCTASAATTTVPGNLTCVSAFDLFMS